MQELADLLAREHVQLEFLLFKTVELHMLLRAGEPRFLRWAAAELNRAGDRVRECEERRSELVAKECAGLGVTDGLTELTRHASEPWQTIFSDHLRDMSQLTIELESNRQAAREIARADGHSIVQALEQMYRPPVAQLPMQRYLMGGAPVVLPDSLA